MDDPFYMPVHGRPDVPFKVFLPMIPTKKNEKCPDQHISDSGLTIDTLRVQALVWANVLLPYFLEKMVTAN